MRAALRAEGGPLILPAVVLVAQWGKRSGIPVLFVHGGPGNCVADYQNVNARFFDASIFFVVEVDQRGTGRSQPSVSYDTGARLRRPKPLHAAVKAQLYVW